MTNNNESTAKGGILSEMWRTRPVRIPSSQNSGAWFAGIAEGIGVRYQISPVLIRLGFAALSLFAGLGLFLYLILLLILPRYTVPVSPMEAFMNDVRDPRVAHDRNVGLTAGFIAVFLAIGASFSFDQKDLLGLVIVAVVAFALHERHPEPPADFHAGAYSMPKTPKPKPHWPSDADGDIPPYGTGYAAGYGAAPGFTSANSAYSTHKPTDTAATAPLTNDYTAAEGFATNEQMQTPPSWDPLGAAPFAWDLPEPGEEEVTSEKKKKNSIWGKLIGGFIAFILVAALALTALGAWDLVNGSESSQTNAVSTAKVYADPEKSDSAYRFVMASGELNLAKLSGDSMQLGHGGAEIMNLDATMATVDVVLPERIDGPTYKVQLECPKTVMAVSVCDMEDEFVVKGTGKEQDAPVLLLRVNAIMSSLHVRQE